MKIVIPLLEDCLVIYERFQRHILCFELNTVENCAVLERGFSKRLETKISDEKGNGNEEKIGGSAADWCKNCGICGKSTKFCTKIENYRLNSISYGSTWDLSHNCNYNLLSHFQHGNEAG